MSAKAGYGSLDIIGVGPGDPELLTLMAVRRIGLADVVAYPVTESGRSRARTTAGAFIKSEQEELGFTLPMSVDPGPAQRAYDGVSLKIRAHLEAGRSVALLCEGDPFYYGSAMYIYARLSHDFTTYVVPGVSSLTAAAATAGRPLASRNDILKVLPAPLAEDVLRAELSACQSAVIIKVGRHFDKVRRVIEELGRSEDAAMIVSETGDEQRVVALSDLQPEAQAYFSTVLVTKGVGA